MTRTRVKICGVCSAEDAALAVSSGADAIGVILAESPRRLSLADARVVMDAVPAPVARVGVFVDASPEFVATAVRELGLSYVQFSGCESPEACTAAPAPVIKAVRVTGELDPEIVAAYRGSAAALLLDTYVPGVAGGTGRAFSWQLVGELPADMPVVVAGGLGPENVRDAVRTLRPFAVDVSSGVEARPRVKDPARMEAFFAAVSEADEEAS